ncbi:outer membrane protein assembly factor BamB family protein [Arthrobacter sp. CG_A4]|uniref:outer membrane protein assembly factor BamB family protein n=1 Tax=Arthrobacter sp. CG_A4 TaxID=3071706 RepID=UPI002DF7FF5E|nr:streptogramin lyase [Arthrobacter sp. CG_A4]
MKEPSVEVRRRTVLSFAVALGAGSALSAGTGAAPATAQVPASSLDLLKDIETDLTVVGSEPAALLRRYRNVFASLPDPNALFFRTQSGVLKIAAGSAGLSDQVQVLDAATGRRDATSVPFPGLGGGAGSVVYEPFGNTILAFGASAEIKRVSLTGVVTTGYTASPGTTNASYSPATDSKGRIWSGNYPTGTATRFDPTTGSVVHTASLHQGAQYVRSLAIDSNDNVYAGTGTDHPRIVTWHTDNPASLREIALPAAAAVGFVRRIVAHRGTLFVYYDGPDGGVKFGAYDTDAARWMQVPWTWMPSGRVTASLPGSNDIYAVWNTVGLHKLMRIDSRTLSAEFICLVPDTARSMLVEIDAAGTMVNILCGEDGRYEWVRVSVSELKVIRSVLMDFAVGAFKVQTLLASLNGALLYFGGYLGDGIGSVDVTTREAWRSGTQTGIEQIEGMFQYDENSIFVGSYTGGGLFRFNPTTRSVRRLVKLADAYSQDRPVAWAAAGGRVIAGTVPIAGRTGGSLAIINPENDADIVVVPSPIPGQSVLGLIGEGDFVYGTTGIKGGYGSVDDTKPAHVFAFDVRRNRIVWTRPVAGEVEINSPLLLRGVLYVSTNNGVVRLNKASGSLVASFRLLDRTAKPGYRTSSISLMPRTNCIVHLCGGTVTVLDPYSRSRHEILQGSYSSMVVSSRGRLYFAEAGTNIVEIDATRKASIRSAADLVTVGPDGWLYIARSLGSGKYGKPFRANSAFAVGVRSCHVVDWNGDGIFDVLTNRTDGTLQLHRGTATGGFQPATIVGNSVWNTKTLSVGMWGGVLTVISADKVSGALQSWPVLSTGLLGQASTIGSGWGNRGFVMLVPSRSTAAALITNQGGSLYRYARVAGGKVSTSPTRLSSGAHTWMTAFSPITGHKEGYNGIAGIDGAGQIRYFDVAPASVGSALSYAFPIKSHKLASS